MAVKFTPESMQYGCIASGNPARQSVTTPAPFARQSLEVGASGQDMARIKTARNHNEKTETVQSTPENQ
jgi:hypothetical protein